MECRLSGDTWWLLTSSDDYRHCYKFAAYLFTAMYVVLIYAGETMEALLKKRQFILYLLLGISLIAIFYIMVPAIQDIRSTDFSVSATDYLPAACFCLFTLLFKAWVHLLILGKYRLPSVTGLQTVAAYANGQIVKYIPGKVLGVVSQSIRMADLAKASIIWEANVTQYLITNIVSVLVLAMLAAGFFLGDLFAVLPGMLLLCLTIPLLVRNILTHLFNYVTGFFAINPIEPQGHSWKQASFILFCLCVEWVFYFMIWYYLSGGESPFFLYIGWFYAVASWLALMAFVVPGGVLVREAIFIWLGSLFGLPIGQLFFYSIVFRILYITCEIIFYIVIELLLVSQSCMKN